MKPALAKTWRALGLTALFALAFGSAQEAGAKVFASQNQALAEAFPNATRI